MAYSTARCCKRVRRLFAKLLSLLDIQTVLLLGDKLINLVTTFVRLELFFMGDETFSVQNHFSDKETLPVALSNIWKNNFSISDFYRNIIAFPLRPIDNDESSVQQQPQVVEGGVQQQPQVVEGGVQQQPQVVEGGVQQQPQVVEGGVQQQPQVVEGGVQQQPGSAREVEGGEQTPEEEELGDGDYDLAAGNELFHGLMRRVIGFSVAPFLTTTLGISRSSAPESGGAPSSSAPESGGAPASSSPESGGAPASSAPESGGAPASSAPESGGAPASGAPESKREPLARKYVGPGLFLFSVPDPVEPKPHRRPRRSAQQRTSSTTGGQASTSHATTASAEKSDTEGVGAGPSVQPLSSSTAKDQSSESKAEGDDRNREAKSSTDNSTTLPSSETKVQDAPESPVQEFQPTSPEELEQVPCDVGRSVQQSAPVSTSDTTESLGSSDYAKAEHSGDPSNSSTETFQEVQTSVPLQMDPSSTNIEEITASLAITTPVKRRRSERAEKQSKRQREDDESEESSSVSEEGAAAGIASSEREPAKEASAEQVTSASPSPSEEKTEATEEELECGKSASPSGSKMDTSPSQQEPRKTSSE